tara:strand:+ start:83 stop:1216 length:1134 start_codon:yes stop_codon:yes gene_type:complete
MRLIEGDCLEEMKNIDDNSIDLLFCDLPYGQTRCNWDSLIDLNLFWKEVNRICKDTTPMFFTCSTKFGVSLINSNPKNFRYDLVWVKSASCGFLLAKKMPLKKHEMIYVFYRKLPLYDLSSHTHKFIKSNDTGNVERKEGMKQERNTPKLEECLGKEYLKNKPNYRKINPNLGANGTDCHIYDPPLPNSVVRTDKGCSSLYGNETNKVMYKDDNGKIRNTEPRYDPPLPNSVVRDTTNYKNESELYGNIKRSDFMRENNEPTYNPPLPNSVVKILPVPQLVGCEGKVIRKKPIDYNPPLPNTILEVKSEKGKHATQKPTELIKWILKYYSKEGDVVLDPTMGSGSTGVACKDMNRDFIGIELNNEIFKIAQDRLGDI